MIHTRRALVLIAPVLALTEGIAALAEELLRSGVTFEVASTAGQPIFATTLRGKRLRAMRVSLFNVIRGAYARREGCKCGACGGAGVSRSTIKRWRKVVQTTSSPAA